jgi:aldose 1-epimerase
MCSGGKESSLRLSVPIGKKCGLTDRFNSDEKFYPLNERDLEYKKGIKVPTGQVIENDMYTAVMNTYKDKDFYGTIVVDTLTGHKVFNEVSEEFKFWNIWNDKGNKGYYCPEPMTALINAPNLSLPKDVSGYSELAEEQTFKCWQKFFTT